MKPSQTTRGQAWLQNFHPSEQDAACLLIDSLEIADAQTIHIGLVNKIEELRSELDGGPAVLIPVLSLEDVEEQLEQSRRAAGTLEDPVLSGHVAYRTFLPGMPIPATPGSEGAIGNLIRDFTGDDSSSPRLPWLHPASSIEQLRDQRCRYVVLISDYAGSGTQIADFALTFARNKTIRSWQSSGLIRTVAITYASSSHAREKVEEKAFRGRPVISGHLRVVHPARSFSDAGWSFDEREAIEELCRRWAKPGHAKEALGFGGSGGLFVSHGAIPNNIPYILRKVDSGWNAFFERRRFPTDLQEELGNYQAPQDDLATIANDLRQQRLSRALASGRLSAPADMLVAVLAILNNSRQSAAQLAHALHRNDEEIAQLLGFLTHSGFIGQNHTLTDRGRRELTYAKHLDRFVTAQLVGSQVPYYPQSLR